MRVVQEENLDERTSKLAVQPTPFAHQWERRRREKSKGVLTSLSSCKLERKSVKREENSFRNVESTLVHSSESTRAVSHWPGP